MERERSWVHEYPQDADDGRHRGPLFKMWGNDERVYAAGGLGSSGEVLRSLEPGKPFRSKRWPWTRAGARSSCG